jgi:GT2 family glycosyltransferase/glycosyltransferase involved in cell wall biosynthesis
MAASTQSGKQAAKPICSIIIPTKDKLNFLQPCIESVLASEDSDSFEILIIDNESVEETTKQYLQSIGNAENIRVLQWQESFNFSAINNFAAQQCRSDYICFLNNDIEISDPQWLGKLLAIASIKEVGAVGCTLLYPDTHIQHAGIALDEKAIAQPLAVGEASDFLKHAGISLPYAVDAVTAACLLMRKTLFLRLGGFNEDQLAVAFNDVDLCLRLADKGLPVLCHPGVVLLHHESVSRQSDKLPFSRKRELKEHAFMKFRWRIRLLGRRFINTIPNTIKEAALANEAAASSIEEIIRIAADNLYLQDSASRLSSKEMRGMYSAAATLSETQDYFKHIQNDFRNLEAHAQRLQHAHELIENSIFWRMTYPLRWLKSAVTGDSKRQLPALGAADVLNEATLELVQEGQQAEKQRLDSSAKASLDMFLAGTDNINIPPSTSVELSIVLVFYQQAHLSLLCLQSLIEFADVNYELIIVDNNSTDATSKLLDKITNATIIRNTENLGFVKAVNQAGDLATGEYLLLLNNDALIEKKALSNAMAVIVGDDSVGAVGAKIKLLDASLQEAGSIIWSDGACLGYGRGDSPEQSEYMFQRDVDYCSGAFLLFRRRHFIEMGGFDLDYAPAYYEESDFCIRLQKKGLRIVYTPTSQITHYEFASSGGLEGASKLQAEHRQLLCDKHADFLSQRRSNNPGNVLAARTRNNFPNILIIDDRVPYPSLGSGYPRCSNILNELSKLDFNISFYPLQFPKENWDDVYHTVANNIEVILDSGKDDLLSFLSERKDFYQYVVVSRVHNMEFLNHCLSLDPDLIGDAKIIYDAEAVTAPREILRMEFLGKSMPIKDQQELIDTELEQSKLASKIVAVSNNEAEIFKSHGYRNTTVLGHTLASKPGANTFAQREGLLFVGALRDEGSPNVDSLLWFLINVFPLLEQALPNIKIHIVGDNSAPSLAVINKANINFTGRLESIEEMYNSSRIFIAPTRFAAGIPHKIHEAAAKGLPSVSSTLLARQLGWQDGKQILVADSPEDYAAKCIKLYQQEDVWQAVRDAGLRAIEQDCSEETFRKNLAGLFSD